MNANMDSRNEPPFPSDASSRTPLKVICLLMAGIGVVLLGVFAYLVADRLNAAEGESVDWIVPGVVAFFGFDLLVMAGVVWKLGNRRMAADAMR